MDHSGYPIFSEEIPPEYQALFQAQFLNRNVFQPHTVDHNHQTDDSWAPFHGSSQPLDNAFLSSGANAQGPSQMNMYSTLYNHAPEQPWDYSYCWQLLSEPQEIDTNSSINLDGPKFSNATSFATSSTEPTHTVNSNLQHSPSNLYSTMLKKGLNILPGFLKNPDDDVHPKPESSRNTLNRRRNSYPNTSLNLPTTRPVSMPLDPITLSIPKKSSKKPTRIANDTIQEMHQETFDSVLNNCINISCTPNSKCTLNVNNDFNESPLVDKEPIPTPPESTTTTSAAADLKCEPEDKQSGKRKSKPKVSQSNSSVPEMPSSCSRQESVKRNKSKGSQNKNRTRTERGKPNRKRQSLPDTEVPSPLFNLVFQLQVLLGQILVQPLLVSITETLVSLMGMAVGLLWVFAMLSYEWAQMLFQLVHRWALCAWHWLRAHGGDLISALFLRIPNEYYASTGSSRKSNNTSNTNEEFNLPKTGEEAVRRLLKCKETDPYSILGITSDATDEDIKRSYKTQAILVHPDKNHFAGAEEAFKILASAFEIIGNPESRACYDRENAFSQPRSEASQEISDFLEKLKQNIEEAQSFLGCQNCGKAHKRYRMERTPLEARYCAACKEKHAAKEGDLWAETTMMGFKWHYYSYLDGAIYDVTEWVTCQPNLVSRVEANTHYVPCRLATPKNKNRSAAYSRMEDLKDLVNDLLNANQNAGADSANQRAAPQNGKMKTKRAPGGRRKK